MVTLTHHRRGVVLPVRAQAGARRSGILGTHDGMLRVAVTAAREKGRANQAIVAVLSDALGVPKSAIELVSGATSSQKRFLIVGGDADELETVIAQMVSD